MDLMIQYRVKEGLGDIQAEAVKGFVANIAGQFGQDIQYTAFRLPDGLSFKHLAWIKDEDTKTRLQAQPFFAEFSKGVQERAEEPPSVTPLTNVASTVAG